MPRWLYQGKAEPVSQAKESPGVDKWSPVFPPLRRPLLALTAAIMAGACFLGDIPRSQTVYAPAWQTETPDNPVKSAYPRHLFKDGAPFVWNPPVVGETVTVDKWFIDRPPYFAAKPGLSRAILAGSCFVGDIPRSETINAPAWGPELPDIQFAKPGLSRAILAGHYFAGDWQASQPTFEPGWIGEAPDVPPPRSYPRYLFAGGAVAFVWNPPGVGEVVTVDKWFVDRPVFLFSRPALSRAIAAGSFFQSDIPRAETVYISALQPVTPPGATARAFPRHLYQQGAAFIWTPPIVETITLDKWFMDRPVILYPRAALTRAIVAGSFFIGDIPRRETIYTPAWQPELPDIRFLKDGLSRGIAAGAFFLGDIPRIIIPSLGIIIDPTISSITPLRGFLLIAGVQDIDAVTPDRSIEAVPPDRSIEAVTPKRGVNIS